MKAVVGYLLHIRTQLACLLFLVLGSLGLALIPKELELNFPLTVAFVGVGHFCLWMIMDMLVPLFLNTVRDAWKKGGWLTPFRIYVAIMDEQGFLLSLGLAFFALLGLVFLFGSIHGEMKEAAGFPFRYLFFICLLMTGILLAHAGWYICRQGKMDIDKQ